MALLRDYYLRFIEMLMDDMCAYFQETGHLFPNALTAHIVLILEARTTLHV